MGREAHVKVTWGDKKASGKALLETDDLVFRSDDFRLAVKFEAITAVTVKDGLLHITWGRERATFDLGDDADAWADRIRHPKPLLDKLGIKAGARVVLLGLREEGFLADLAERTEDVHERIGAPADIILYLVDAKKRLDKIPDLIRGLKADGSLWIVHPKGRQDIKDTDVLAAGRAAGLVDNKVCRFSATHSALRFVVPKARRPQAP